ncbi:MAG TPA: hypothetical protein VIZ17_07320 [Acetobacteraceae bacterium]
MSESQAEWVRRVLGYEVGAVTPQPGGQDALGPVRFAKLRLAWLDARAGVQSDLERLRAAALEEFAGDPVTANLARLDEVLAGFAAGLEDSLDVAASAADPARRTAALAAARPVAQRYLDHVLNDALIDHIETNPFTPVTISGRLLGPLSDILQALAGAQKQQGS